MFWPCCCRARLSAALEEEQEVRVRPAGLFVCLVPLISPSMSALHLHQEEEERDRGEVEEAAAGVNWQRA